MPKQKITKDMVIEAAFQLAREGGMERVLVKSIAEKLNCSVQPIYSYLRNMEELKREVGERAGAFVRTYVEKQIDSTERFQSTGQAYLRLAGEEPEIFKIFILREREGISSLEDLYRREADPKVAEQIGRELGISPERVLDLHLNLLIYTIGLGAVFSVTRPGIPLEEMQKRQEVAYRAFLEETKRETSGKFTGNQEESE